MPISTVAETLKHKFWSGLEDKNIKNALRHRYKELEFDDLVIEARTIEDEADDNKKCRAKSHQISATEEKLDRLIMKIDKMESELQALKTQ